VRIGEELKKPPQKQEQPTITQLLSTLKQFKGITRKSALGELLPILGENVYDDAGVLDIDNGLKIVVSADGIVEGLVRDDPWLAGFYSVVVNVNDVVAKGARPLGYVHVVSSNSPSTRRQIVQGIKHGIGKYGLKFLKGHTHPDTSYDAIDAAVVGATHSFLSSAAAKPRDSLIVAVDLDGNPGLRSWVKTFDSVMFKSSRQVLNRLEAIVTLAEEKLASACRDISGPGVVGTIGMLCESSRVGASLSIEKIPKPRKLELLDWLLTYPSTGFVLTTDKPHACLRLLENHGLTANAVGRITETRAIRISYRGQIETFMNLSEDSIFGFKEEKAILSRTEKHAVKELSEKDTLRIEALLKKVWSTSYEYPEEWRTKRILTERQVRDEMQQSCHYFGIEIDGKLAGIYKAWITDTGLFGEHQSVDPEYRGLGLATAMYHQFIGFAKENKCRRVYVNTLVNQAATIKTLKKLGFHKTRPEYEQAKGMRVQTYELHV